MASGNSGSMQSSSGGDEEYDSLPPAQLESNISPFFNSPAAGGYFGTSITNQPTTLFDSPSHNNLTGPFSQPLLAANQDPNNTPFNNLDFPWSRGPRSESSNYSHSGNFAGLSSSSSSSQALVGNNQGPSSVPLGPTEGTTLKASPSPQPDQTNTAAVKNPKKRTRASRIAPTTVLTTDTTNFRQMVQEFTGIPNSPFSGPSPYSRRLDLFGSCQTLRAVSNLDTIGGPLHHPLRPLAQKVQLPLFVSSSSTSSSWLSSNMIDAIGITPSESICGNTNGSCANSMADTAANTFSSTTNNFQLPSDIGLQKQSQNILNMQNPILSLQPILNSTLPAVKNPFGNAPIFNTQSKGSSSINPSLDELGSLNNEPVNSNNLSGGGFSIQRSSDNLASRKDGGTRNDQENFGSLNGNHGSYKLNSSSIPFIRFSS